jgi:acetyl esterase/lipase
MGSLHLVRPELRPFLETFPVGELSRDMLPMARQAPVLSRSTIAATPGVLVEERWVLGPDEAPDVRVLIYRPTDVSGPTPAVLHIHGGGFVVGAPEMDDATNRTHALEFAATIVSVDYRLTPEHPFPAPLEDCYAALRWLHANSAQLGVDASRIAIKGESAGGGLAAGLALLARDRGEIPIAFQCLIYPMIDDRPPAERHPYTGEFIWNAKSNSFGWSCYLGRDPGGEGVSPYAAPARADDLAGLPPTLIVTAALDLFVEENLEYARRLLRAGVAVELLLYPGAYHGYHVAGDTELLRRSERDLRAAMTAALGA